MKPSWIGLLRRSAGISTSLLLGISFNLVGSLVLAVNGIGELSGVALGLNIYWVLSAFGIGFVMGGIDPLLARAHAKDDQKTVVGVMTNCLLAVAGCSVLACFVCLAIIAAFEQSVVFLENPGLSKFLLVTTATLPFHLTFVVIQRFYFAINRTYVPLFCLIFANIFNLFFVIGSTQGALGSALVGSIGIGVSTGICYVLCVLALLAHLYFGLGFRLQFHGRSLFARDLFGQIAKLGIPAAMQGVLEVLFFSILAWMVAALGAEKVALHYAFAMATYVAFTLSNGIGAGVSLSLGAMDVDSGGDMKKMIGRAVALLGVMLMLYVLVLKVLKMHFYDSEDLGHLIESSSILMFVFLFSLLDGIQLILGGALRGRGNTTSAFHAAMVGYYLVGIPVSAALAFLTSLGLRGVWIGALIGLAASMLYLSTAISRSRVVFALNRAR